MQNTRLTITGMECDECENCINRALQSVAGVQSSQVDWATGTALVWHAKDIDTTQFIEAIAKVGHQAYRVWSE